MKNRVKSKLIIIDLAVYCIASIGFFILGIVLMTSEAEMSTSKNLAMGLQIMGVFVLLIGIVMGIVTFMKIRDLKF